MSKKDEKPETDGDIGLVNVGGRPRHYNSPEEFDQRVNDYYQHCREYSEPITWTGLALFMGFSSRQAIDEYLKYDGFYDSVKRAKALVEYGYEKLLHKGQNAAAPIFALKNFGWSDKSESDDTPTQPVNINISVKEPVSDVKVTRGESES